MADETPDPVSQAEAPAASLESQLTTATTETPVVPDVPTSAVVTTQDGAAAAPVAQPASEGWQGVRDYAKSRGVELPYADDGAALEALLTAHRNAGRRDYYADLGQRLAPQAPQIQQYLAEQTRAAAAPPAPPAWQPPEFNKAWVAQVELDEATGQLRSKAGYDPGIAEKVTAYKNWRDEFLDDPAKVVGPLVEARARDLIRQEFAQHQQQATASQIIQSHAQWMYVADSAGRPQLTPEGAVYASTVQQFAPMVADPRQLDAIATMAVQNDIYRRKAAVAAPAAGGAAVAPVTAASVGGGNTRPSQGAPPAPDVSRKGMTLRQMLQSATARTEFSNAS